MKQKETKEKLNYAGDFIQVIGEQMVLSPYFGKVDEEQLFEGIELTRMGVDYHVDMLEGYKNDEWYHYATDSETGEYIDTSETVEEVFVDEIKRLFRNKEVIGSMVLLGKSIESLVVSPDADYNFNHRDISQTFLNSLSNPFLIETYNEKLKSFNYSNIGMIKDFRSVIDEAKGKLFDYCEKQDMYMNLFGN